VVSLYCPSWALPLRLPVQVQPSETLRHTNDPEKSTTSTYSTRLKEIFSAVTGVWRVRFDLRSSSSAYTAYGAIYRNGSPHGASRSTTSTTYVTFTEDLSFTTGDRIQLYGAVSSGGTAYVRNFRLYGDAGEGVGVALK